MTFKKTIILDVDDVLTPTVSKIVEKYNEEYNENITLDDIVNYFFKDCPKLKYDAEKYFSEHEFYAKLQPYEDALEGVRVLQEHGYDIVIATATERPGYNDRHDWLVHHFKSIPRKNIAFITRKDLLCADWIFDDNLDNLLGCKCEHKVRMERPWNDPKNHPEATGLKGVKSFKEFVELVLESDK